jgi:hypothetical protein
MSDYRERFLNELDTYIQVSFRALWRHKLDKKRNRKEKKEEGGEEDETVRKRAKPFECEGNFVASPPVPCSMGSDGEEAPRLRYAKKLHDQCKTCKRATLKSIAGLEKEENKKE